MAYDKKLDKGTDTNSDNGAVVQDQSDKNKPSAGDTTPDSGSVSKDYKLRVNGIDHDFTEGELIEMVSKGLDYTQKTQVIAEQKKKMEPDQEFINRMDTDPAFATDVTEAINDIVASQNTNSSDDGSDPKVLAELKGLRQQVANLNAERQFESLELKHPDAKIDKEVLATFMLEHKITNPEHAFIIMNADVLQKKAKLEGLKAGKTDKNAIIVSPGGSGIKSEPAVDVTKLSKLEKNTRALALFAKLKGQT